MKKISLLQFAQSLWLILFVIFGAFAQSSDQNYPTLVVSSDLSGTVRARDAGDSRATRYFFLIDGRQGDVFVNVVTTNFDGDIEIFAAETLKPLTKITVYSDNPNNETGRVVYLREPQKLILRIEGRTPTDEPATYRIKIAGSFVPFPASVAAEQPKAPEVVARPGDGEVRVNSVGTIIGPRPTPTPVATPSPTPEPSPKPVKVDESVAVNVDKKTPKPKSSPRPVLVVEDTVPPAKPTEPAKKPPVETAPSPKKTPRPKPAPKSTPKTTPKPAPKSSKATPPGNDSENTASNPTPAEKARPANPVAVKKPEPKPLEASELEGIKLKVTFKDGRRIERPLSEVLRFGVDQGILTVMLKSGSIGRYSMLEVEKITIE